MQTLPVVLITGCGSGIGQALARAFHRQGLRVCATGRRSDTLAPLAAEGLLCLPLDVTDAQAVQTLREDLRQRGLHVGTLVNNAGHGAMGPLLDLPQAEWLRQFEVNLFAPMALVRAFVPDMVAAGRGLVVNISSVSGVMPTPFAGAYCASKAAMNAASDSLRMELAPLGVRVVTVQPGGIRSDFGQNATRQVSLAPDSLYQPIREGVLARANDSQSDATPPEVFAQQLVAQLAAAAGASGGAQPPAVVRLGKKSALMPWLKRWLPEATLDVLLQKRFRLDRLKAPGR